MWFNHQYIFALEHDSSWRCSLRFMDILASRHRDRDHRCGAHFAIVRGDGCRLANGPFAGFTGSVEEIFAERRRVKVLVTIFGRATPIDLDFMEVQPI